MRWLRVVAIAIAAGVLQVSLLSSSRMDGVVPNLVLVVVVCMTIWGSASEAILTAVIAGLFMDMSGSGSFGLATSCLVLISLVMTAVRQLGVDGEVLVVRLALVIGATLIWGLIHILAIGAGSFALAATWHVVALEIVLNCLIVFICPERIFRGARTV